MEITKAYLYLQNLTSGEWIKFNTVPEDIQEKIVNIYVANEMMPQHTIDFDEFGSFRTRPPYDYEIKEFYQLMDKL